MANQLYYGSINYDELLKAVKSGNAKTSIVTRQNGETFRAVDVNVWINEAPDQYKNDGSISVQLKKEAYDRGEKGPYIGNLKKSTPTVIEADPNAFNDEDDLPF